MASVILVDEQDTPVGTMEKMEAHRAGALHRAFSIFIFNSKGELLLQQRAPGKYHSAGLWTNTCCSHPAPGESSLAAAQRRLREEMGLTCPLQQIFTFTYKVSFDNGLTENELDHIFIGHSDDVPVPDPAEALSFRYMSPEQIAADIAVNASLYTEWFKMLAATVFRHVKAGSKPLTQQ